MQRRYHNVCANQTQAAILLIDFSVIFPSSEHRVCSRFSLNCDFTGHNCASRSKVDMYKILIRIMIPEFVNIFHV